MKPIPPGYCEAADSAVIPGRPWWWSINGGFMRSVGAFHVWPGVPMWMGADAEIAHRANPRNVFVAPLEWLPGNPRADLGDVIAAVERIDAEHPIPHPGFRAGQVWLEPYGEGWTERVIVLAFGGTSYTPDGGRGVTSPGGSFLLHDPLMPSKAPWGPA